MRKSVVLFLLLSWVYIPAAAQQSRQLQFRHIFDGTFLPETLENVNWMEDGQYYTALVQVPGDMELRRYDLLTGDFQVLVATSDMEVEGRREPIIIQDYQFSADESKILIATDTEPIWRRSTRENYFVYDLETGETVKLTQAESKQQYGQLSPEGDKAAFVIDNDLYWVNLSTGEETRITSDGEAGSIINGATDWVYEEEFGIAKGWFWSPDGTKIAFYRFDESEVREFFMTGWGSLYPELINFKYPKAGEQNSTVAIGVYDLESGQTSWLDVLSDEEQYIPRINWTRDSGTLAIRRMNRLQNRQDLMLADVNTGNVEIIKTELSETWIDINDDLRFLENGEQFIYASEESGYNHLYLYDMDGSPIRQITSGDWEVTNFLGYNETDGTIYYISTEESPLERHLYRININGGEKQKMSMEEGWHSINMSSDFSYYIDTYSGPSTPNRYTLYEGDGTQVRVLEDNDELSERLKEYNLPDKEYITIDLPQADLNGYILRPHNFDPTQKYPVLVYVYGGPGIQTVTKQFEVGHSSVWHQYLTTHGYVVVSIDNRGTAARGRRFEHQIYKRLGQDEVTDQLDAVRYLIDTYSFIDADRIGVWGWSYGGYMSTLLMARGNDLYKAGIAVAPVTHWKFYDTIYTERFMQTPAMNPDGYEDGSPLNMAGQIKGDYLLVHGTGDDNVHFQNAVELVDALIQGGVQFETMYYPNRNHGIFGGNTRIHLYEMMTDFILEKL